MKFWDFVPIAILYRPVTSTAQMSAKLAIDLVQPLGRPRLLWITISLLAPVPQEAVIVYPQDTLTLPIYVKPAT